MCGFRRLQLIGWTWWLEDEVGREDEVDSEVSPNRVEGGSKVKDCFGIVCWVFVVCFVCCHYGEFDQVGFHP